MSSTGESSSRKGNSKAAKSNSRIAKAGLTFPVDKVNKDLKKGKYANRIYTAAAVHLTAVLECLASEVLKVAGNESVKENKKRIHPGHLTQAVKNNDELMQLLQNVTIPSADVAPRGGKW